jgi:hypothetical protein
LIRWFRAGGLLLALGLTALHASAQREAPSPVEAKSAYCISALGDLGREAQILAALPAPKARQEAHREAAAAYEQDAKRLRGFLLPRLKFLDSEAVLKAADRGKADVQVYLQAQQACKARCETPSSAAGAGSGACESTCLGTEPAAGRVFACRPLNWLSN